MRCEEMLGFAPIPLFQFKLRTLHTLNTVFYLKRTTYSILYFSGVINSQIYSRAVETIQYSVIQSYIVRCKITKVPFGLSNGLTSDKTDSNSLNFIMINCKLLQCRVESAAACPPPAILSAFFLKNVHNNKLKKIRDFISQYIIFINNQRFGLSSITIKVLLIKYKI